MSRRTSKMKDKNIEKLESPSQNESKERRNSKEKGVEKPSPLNFDEFIPWACSQWQTSKFILIKRMVRDDSSKCGTKTQAKSDKEDSAEYDSSVHVDASTLSECLPLTTYYDGRGNLVEVAIIRYSHKIPRTLIQAFCICFPLQPLLTKLTICRGGLNQAILYEIGKLLPASNLTDICLDDSYVPQNNYYVLLDQTSQLKHLSLCRCGINDDAFKEIVVRLAFDRPASNFLQMLNMTGNEITDAGACTFAQVLRKNRQLLYLNLSGNKITDVGVLSILNTLKQFPLTFYEILETKRRKLKHLENEERVFKNCLEDAIARRRIVDENLSIVSSKRTTPIVTMKLDKSKKLKTKSTINSVSVISPEELASIMAREIVGKFEDSFDTQYTVINNGITYAIGNLKLCYLNVAYNDLEFSTVQNVHEVVGYQSSLNKPSNCTGLLKIVLDGNNIPDKCVELEEIEMFLKTAIYTHTPKVVNNVRKQSMGSVKKGGSVYIN